MIITKGTNVHRFLEGYGIKVRPIEQAREPRPANIVYGGRTFARMLRKDEGRTALVVRCIQASDPTCFYDDMAWAIWKLINAHRPLDAPQTVVREFGAINIGRIRRRARSLAYGEYGPMGKKVDAICTLIADALIEKEAA